MAAPEAAPATETQNQATVTRDGFVSAGGTAPSARQPRENQPHNSFHRMTNRTKHLLARYAPAFLLWSPTVASADVYSEIETHGTKSAYHADPNVNSRRTDHFVMRFGPKPRGGLMAEQMYHCQMQFLEHCYAHGARGGVLQ